MSHSFLRAVVGRPGASPDRAAGWRRAAGLLLVATMLVACAGCTTSGRGSSDANAVSSGASRSTPGATRSAGGAGASTSGSGVNWPQVADDVEPSVVSISVQAQGGGDQGSGEVIDGDGHVLTNNHVVAPAADGGQIQVALSDARVFPAKLVGADPVTDLAVVQVQGAPDDLRALRFGDSAALRVGQPVMALGNPLGLSHTVTLGIVSALDRPVTTQNPDASSAQQGTPVVTNAIQTDAAVNPGNSGGALVDSSGRLIGVNSSIATLGAGESGQGGSIGLGFAIPAAQARWVSRALIDKGTVQHAFLGVSPQDAVVRIDGVRREVAGISRVVSGSQAARAGLRAGEAVVEVDGETVAGAASLVAQIREREPGTKVVLTVADRSGTTRQVPVEFGTQPTG
jgi:putative serine protease PepD